MGGSNLCFDFGSSPGPQEIHREYIAYEVLFSDETSLITNTSYCNLDVWIDGSKGILLHGRDKGSFHKIDARLKIENPEFYKVMKVRCMIPSFLTCRDHSKLSFSDTSSNRVFIELIRPWRKIPEKNAFHCFIRLSVCIFLCGRSMFLSILLCRECCSIEIIFQFFLFPDLYQQRSSSLVRSSITRESDDADFMSQPEVNALHSVSRRKR